MSKMPAATRMLRGGLFLCLVILGACKGGGGGNLITLSGTAATGAPMQGLVTVTNALGQVSQQAVIGSNQWGQTRLINPIDC